MKSIAFESKIRNRSIIYVLLCFFLVGCFESSKRQSSEPLTTVNFVNLDRYLGEWYEIARFPFSVQEGCHSTSAKYERRSDGKISVRNRCVMGSFDGKESIAEGKAWVTDTVTNAKLKVSFNFFMSLFGGGDYWVIDLASDYSYSVVSEPKGRYLWILSRKPQMDAKTYSDIVERLRKNGFMTENLQKTPQQSHN